MKEEKESYTELIPIEELSKYTIVKSWGYYFREVVKKDPVTPFFKDLIIDDEVVFDKEYNHKITFNNCYFKKGLRFIKSVCAEAVVINSCFIDDGFSVGGSGSEFKRHLRIINLSVRGRFTIVNGTFKKCEWSFSNSTNVKIENGSFESLLIAPWKFNRYDIGVLEIDFNNVQGDISVIGGNHSEIDSLILSGGSKELNLSIGNIFINTIAIANFRFSESFKIQDIYPLEIEQKETQFLVGNSYLGKTEFYNVDFSKFSRIVFSNSHLVDCTFVNVIWAFNFQEYFNYNNSQEGREPEVLEGYIVVPNKQREVFRQLKYAMSKQGDVVNEQLFHSLEMKAYLEILTRKKDWETWFVIKLSSLTSNFGQSLLRPFLSLIILNWIFFAIMILCDYKGLSFSWENANTKAFETAFGEYLKLLNPLRKPDDSINGYLVFIDILIRIWSSYMIYNFIRATRRFIK